MGGAVSTGLDNDDLIDNLIQSNYIKTPRIEKVFRAVDRANYFLPSFKMNAYKDLAWKSGNIHISAPCIYSVVMEHLNLSPGVSFLNIGSGTGYLSTMVGLVIGPLGVNHGVEMHADVVKYAYEKLSEFKNDSPALDFFEFCEPIFVEGNGLSFPSDMRQYDRVYCGAACPENYENYVKNLIKVGGVLVMPHNDQLLQITRVSQTKWEHKSILPVSFSTLQQPTPADSKASTAFPDSGPMTLQAVCRSCIRQTLRTNAEQEFPQLTKPIRRRVYPRKKRALQNFVIPFLDSSEDELDTLPGPGPGLLIGSQANITAVFDMGHTLAGRRRLIVRSGLRPGHQEPAMEGNQREEPDAQPGVSTGSSTQRPNNVPKREKFDSGVVEDIDNGKGLISSEDELDSNANHTMTSDEEMDFESDSDVTEQQKSEDEGLEEDIELKHKESETVLKNEQKDVRLTYSSVMRDKIKSLPLPHILKSYLNYHRDF